MKRLFASLVVMFGLMLVSIVVDLVLLFTGRSLIIAPALHYATHELPFRGETFSEDAWTLAGSCAGLSDGACEAKLQTCQRGPMVADLIEQHFTIGETWRDSFSPLLGEPDFERQREGLLCLHQLLGYCSGMRWDYDSFFACYDDGGVLRRVGHLQH